MFIIAVRTDLFFRNDRSSFKRSCADQIMEDGKKFFEKQEKQLMS